MDAYTGTLVYRVNLPDSTAPPENNVLYIAIGAHDPDVEPSIVDGLFVFTMRSRNPITPEGRQRLHTEVVAPRLRERLGENGFTRCPELET